MHFVHLHFGKTRHGIRVLSKYIMVSMGGYAFIMVNPCVV